MKIMCKLLSEKKFICLSKDLFLIGVSSILYMMNVTAFCEPCVSVDAKAKS